MPYLRQELAHALVKLLNEDLATILGSVGQVWIEVAPEQYAANQELREGAEDCMFPTRAQQQSENQTILHRF